MQYWLNAKNLFYLIRVDIVSISILDYIVKLYHLCVRVSKTPSGLEKLLKALHKRSISTADIQLLKTSATKILKFGNLTIGILS